MAQPQKPLVSFAETCRGNGKIYTVLKVSEELQGAELTASSHARGGNQVPAVVVRHASLDACVLVLPVLTASQTCVVSARFGNGETAEVARRVFKPATVRLQSAARRMAKDEKTNYLRNFDANGARFGCEVVVKRIIPSESATFIIHGSVELSGPVAEELQGKLDIRFANERGADAAQTDWICMKDTIGRRGDIPSLFRRVVEFSVQVSQQTKGLTVWACLQGGKSEGFQTHTIEEFAKRRSTWTSETFSAFGDGFYDEWFKVYHAASDIELEAQAMETFAIEPKFSIIVPLYNTPTALFREMADSVLAQSYGNFELVLANSTPENDELAGLIEEYTVRDSRVIRVDLAENRGITENTNEGIKAATGDFLCFLDHDDLLTPDALYWYVRGINDYPETDLLYSDEDKVRDGIYLCPYFKPDWNPDLLTSMNYVCHFLCVRKDIVESLEPPTREYDGSQDHHMTLRASQRARNIYHARRVLYHWRMVEGSTAETIDAKPYAIQAGIRAVQDYIDDRGWKGTVSTSPRVSDHYEAVYELAEHPLVSIVIPNKDSADMLDRCLRSILDKSTYDNFEIAVVENNSVDEATFEYYGKITADEPCVHIIRYEGAFNYSKINNAAVAQVHGDYLLLLNNDTEVITPDWIERLLVLCIRQGTGAAGARLLYPDGTIQHAGIRATSGGPVHIGRFSDGAFPGYACMYAVRQDIGAVTAACMMTTREAFDCVGGFDEDLGVAYNDVDYCYALRAAGYLVVYEPNAELYHYESISRGDDSTSDEANRFARETGILRQKWPESFGTADPYGNPHFRQDSQGAYYRGFA